MQRIKASGVVSVMPPAQENSYDPGYFSNGNPATGELATMMTAEWCNGVQEELLAVIQDANLTPSGTDLKQLLQALKYLFSNSEAEKWRKSMIGALFPFERANLPGYYVKPDGSLILFEDYPEFAEAYEEGAFEGMMLEANASEDDKNTWRAKWVKNSQGTGLYTPRLQGLFLRNGERVGRYNVPGLPDAQGYIRPIADQGKPEEPITNASGAFGVQSYVEGGGGFMSGGTCRATRISMSLANSNTAYGASSTVMPASADIIVGLYLGRLT